MSDQHRDDGKGAPDDDVPGDPACWMRRVCPACGALADADPPVTCPQCGAAISSE